MKKTIVDAMSRLMKIPKEWWRLFISIVVCIAMWMLWPMYGIDFLHTKMVEHQQGISLEPVSPKTDEDEDRSARNMYFTEIGQIGDAFGGLNTLFTAIAGALVFWAGYMQYQSLIQAREEADAEKTARKKLDFESLFFRMLDLSIEVTNNIKTSENNLSQSIIPASGATALEWYAERISEGWNPPEDSEQRLILLVQRFKDLAYNKTPASFGPYFRVLFQIFKHIDTSNLTPQEKTTYSKIVRSQINEGAALLLAINGLGDFGYEFVPYIEKYGLLEHMDQKYKNKYKESLGLAYRDSAFLGSDARKAVEHSDTPKFARDKFNNIKSLSADQQFSSAFNQ
jgi:hypothetical protein